ncbi:MAG: MFS transporter [Simkaniaceae bacterium]|nr:MFS transporter [Simkaniaceae bacterium]
MDKNSSLSLKDSTVVAYVISRVLSGPFWGLFYLFPMILHKDLHATSFQVATLIAIKPVASLFSPYWSQRVHAMRERLISNLILGNILKFSLFLFFPFIDSPWFYIFAVGFHMFLCRGMIPAWMEVLKLKVPKESRSKICAIGSIIDYLGVALLPLFVGGILDNIAESWRILFPVAAVFGMLSTWPIKKIKIPLVDKQKLPTTERKIAHLIDPWKSSWKLLRKRLDFAKFQWGFFLGGAGLMIIQPVLPIYFNHVLHLSYSDVLTAVAALKGIGFVLSSPLWVKFFNRSRIFVLCSVVTLAAAVFPLLLLFAYSSSSIIYIAYIAYGVMQGGSELSWKMSGPIFSREEDSAPYSSVNVLAVGVRGIIFPYLGSFLFLKSENPTFVLLCGMSLCLSATAFLSFNGRKYPIRLQAST